MPSSYRTVAGDVWDMIAYKLYGSTAYTSQLIRANNEYAGTVVFNAGIELVVPEVDTASVSNTLAPPWRA